MLIRCLLLTTVLACAAFAQTRSLDLTAIDTRTEACTDFYQYACGNWLARNPIPADQSSWGRFAELAERNRVLLRDVLETARGKQSRSPVEQKIGDYYGACMDESGIEAKGVAPLKPGLARIAAIPNKAALAEELVRLHRIGVPALFRFTSTQDYKDATEVIAEADQAGLGMPDRDYYLKDDAKSAEIRKQYLAHVQRMFELLGENAETAAAKAKRVMELETALARGSMDRVSRRDPANTYHRMTVEEFVQLMPSFDLKKYLATIGAPALKTLNVASPGFFKAVEAELQRTTLDDLRTYLTWHYVMEAGPFLPKAFVDEWFNFYARVLRGQKEQRPRWKRCVMYADSDLGEALGQKYVEVTFGGDAKERMLKLVRGLEKALERDIQQIDWMTPTTRKRALEKLHAVTNKIGYPEKWRDYSPLEVRASDALGNSHRANTFEFQRQLNKIGKPVDKKEWHMSPPTVNAYYDPQNNNINFPAGILQPPFFDPKIDDAVNLGAIGAVIGHELTHGFDDQGRQFDAEGNMTDWWTAQDAKEFEKRAECIAQQYGDYTAVADVKLNGKLTLGENVADNGGLRIAYMALMDLLAGKTSPKIDGYTPEQRFFLGWAQVWCTADRDETARLRAITDPHSPGKYRVNGTLSNMPEFQKAFGCKAGQPMVSPNACRVW
jgi:endothelin-converting enzyme/putative endopeptidase